MVNSIASKSRQIQSRKKPARRRKDLPTHPGGPRQRDPQDPVFQWLVYIGTSSAGFVMSQRGVWGGLALFIIATIALLLRRNG
jgi:hypothetical protein